ncbi:BCD family MFS transporter [Paracraurococcus lichenis]|uniref:BCD family MFS transporter n=1 Tax=Paracraurococcus lichenis TaxID=3064888 RepID=A0ABT9DU77_9PROT|nr:BCD family MFS transporter [Paracraurococcus sp. LOR1-02]MDO9707449.1 BCD family MFS transporter [Paracraurococcus sp. LOR1-02]
MNRPRQDSAAPIGWLGIVRLGLVQTALGAVVVLTTSAINRVMVVELALPATIPGLLVALHYAVQLSRPAMGHGSDRGGRRTPWIIGGIAVLALGGLGAAAATAVMAESLGLGLALAVLAFLLVGAGVGAAGTSLLALLATRVAPQRRAPAATIVWLMMIAGFVVTTAVAGRFLDPYSPQRLLAVTGTVCAIVMLVTLLAVWGMEPAAPAAGSLPAPKGSFREALAQVWAEPAARRFTVFVFVSMLAYSAQDLILEPFGGQVFGLSLGETTRLASSQHMGVFLGMILAALGGGLGGERFGNLRAWTIGGCLASAAALAVLAAAGTVGPGFPLKAAYVALGIANGAFAAAAIATMMQLAGKGRDNREGMRVGLWGAAQAIAFGLGGLAGAAASDLARSLIASPGLAYGAVFAGEALLFLVSALLATRISRAAPAMAGLGALAPSRP